jgi:NADP-dependent 3-hydroxy acid dehydrogenase YdfG
MPLKTIALIAGTSSGVGLSAAAVPARSGLPVAAIERAIIAEKYAKPTGDSVEGLADSPRG